MAAPQNYLAVIKVVGIGGGVYRGGPGRGVAIAHATLRGKVEHAVKDYEMRNDLEACTELLDSGALLNELAGKLPDREVAKIVGCRESTVRNHLFNARRVLQRALAERYPEYAGSRDRR